MSPATTLTGRWTGHYLQRGQECPISAELVQDGARLSGTMRDGRPDKDYSIFDIAVEAGLPPGADEQIEAQLRAAVPNARGVPIRYLMRLPPQSTIEGRCSGQVVSFVKTYQGASFSGYRVGEQLVGEPKEGHAVHYEGHLTSDGQTIEGRWWIDPSPVTGTQRTEGLFTLRRSSEPAPVEQRQGVTDDAVKTEVPPASDHYERGMAHLKRAEYDEAVSAFTAAINQTPDAPNAYAGRALAYRSLDDETSALRDEQTAQKLGGTRPLRSEAIMLLTPEFAINQRMSQPEAFAGYVKAVIDATESYFKQFPQPHGLDLQVACAVLPQNKMLLEIKADPDDGATGFLTDLRKQIEAIPRPTVKYGPVAFSSVSIIQGGCSKPQGAFGFPFSSLMKPENSPGALDDLLMEAAGLKGQSESLWQRLKRVFGLTT